jgi:hypothetical protein
VVTYPITAPDQMVFQVTVNNLALGVHWEGEISSQSKITEIMFVQEK